MAGRRVQYKGHSWYTERARQEREKREFKSRNRQARMQLKRRNSFHAQREAWEIRYRDLKFGMQIGQGNVAIKKLLGSWFNDRQMVERFREEIDLMSTMHHPNVLLFIGAVLDLEGAGKICLVTEFCQHGNLYDFLHSEIQLTWHIRLGMAMDVARGMHYLHRRAGVIQRDLKSANLLVEENYHIKIADFGLSRRLAPGSMETFCGTPANMAPEIVRQEEYSEKADVFSYGIILWELLTRQDPYPHMSGLALAYAVANEGLRPRIPGYCPEEYATLMQHCWAQDQHQRPGFGDVLDALQAIKSLVRQVNEQRVERAAAARMMARRAQRLSTRSDATRLPRLGSTAVTAASSAAASTAAPRGPTPARRIWAPRERRTQSAAAAPVASAAAASLGVSPAPAAAASACDTIAAGAEGARDAARGAGAGLGAASPLTLSPPRAAGTPTAPAATSPTAPSPLSSAAAGLAASLAASTAAPASALSNLSAAAAAAPALTPRSRSLAGPLAARVLRGSSAGTDAAPTAARRSAYSEQARGERDASSAASCERRNGSEGAVDIAVSACTALASAAASTSMTSNGHCPPTVATTDVAASADRSCAAEFVSVEVLGDDLAPATAATAATEPPPDVAANERARSSCVDRADCVGSRDNAVGEAVESGDGGSGAGSAGGSIGVEGGGPGQRQRELGVRQAAGNE